jgi:hypothetical protein
MTTDISATTDWSMTATGLLPGDRYGCSVVWTPDDGSAGYNTGFSAQSVRSSGSIKFFLETTDLTNGNPRPGVLKAWIRLPDSDFNGTPITLDSGPAVTEIHIP